MQKAELSPEAIQRKSATNNAGLSSKAHDNRGELSALANALNSSPRQLKVRSQLAGIDHSPRMVAQRKAVEKLQGEPVQLKYDHLFNKVQNALAELPEGYSSPTLKGIITGMSTIRENHDNGVDDLHSGPDVNSAQFGEAKNTFLYSADHFKTLGSVDPSSGREFVHASKVMWDMSVDHDVVDVLSRKSAREKSRVAEAVNTWREFNPKFVKAMKLSRDE